ncbi:helix-turn-helix transcriptional regulator [bacterium]|nr:helix-turn-helix transcriptional regulator [bacterium]
MKDILDFPENFIDNLYIEIGNNVKKARMAKGLSQLKLAQMIGHKSVSIVSLAEIYHHKQHFNIEHLAKIAYVLEVDMCELLPKFFNKPCEEM